MYDTVVFISSDPSLLPPLRIPKYKSYDFIHSDNEIKEPTKEKTDESKRPKEDAGPNIECDYCASIQDPQQGTEEVTVTPQAPC